MSAATINPNGTQTPSDLVARAVAGFRQDFRYLEQVLLAANSRKGERKAKATKAG